MQQSETLHNMVAVAANSMVQVRKPGMGKNIQWGMRLWDPEWAERESEWEPEWEARRYRGHLTAIGKL